MSTPPMTPEDERRAAPPGRGDPRDAGPDRQHEREPLSDAELSRITTLSEGAPLQPGAVYLDLLDPAARAFAAPAGMTAADDQLLVAKASVDEELWARLRALNGPDGLGTAGEG
jgi:hypothetical protein